MPRAASSTWGNTTGPGGPGRGRGFGGGRRVWREGEGGFGGREEEEILEGEEGFEGG